MFSNAHLLKKIEPDFTKIHTQIIKNSMLKKLQKTISRTDLSISSNPLSIDDDDAVILRPDHQGVNKFLHAMKYFNNKHDALILENYPDEITWGKCYRHIYKLLYRDRKFHKMRDFDNFKEIMYQKCCKIFNKYKH